MSIERDRWRISRKLALLLWLGLRSVWDGLLGLLGLLFLRLGGIREILLRYQR
jgi:hypothetical protein